MAKNTKEGWLRPASEFPTPLFLVTIGVLTGLILGYFIFS
jgi:hypothetical protein